MFKCLSVYLWKLQLLQEGWATSLGTYWSKKRWSCCSVRAGPDLTYYPTNSINRNRLHWGHKGQDIANDYSIKLEVSAFRLHFDYTYVLRYFVTTDLVKGTAYTRAERKVRSGTGTGCKLLNKGFHTIIPGLRCKLLKQQESRTRCASGYEGLEAFMHCPLRISLVVVVGSGWWWSLGSFAGGVPAR